MGLLVLIGTFDLLNDSGPKMKYTSLSIVSEGLKEKEYFDILDDLQDYYNQTQPYSKEEVEQYFLKKNPHWSEALNLLKREDISTLSLKPVGAYIACRQLKKLAGEDVSIDVFYKK